MYRSIATIKSRLVDDLVDKMSATARAVANLVGPVDPRNFDKGAPPRIDALAVNVHPRALTRCPLDGKYVNFLSCPRMPCSIHARLQLDLYYELSHDC